MLVSIIIPCYNVASHIDRAIQSALAQSYRPVEIWLIDNNSSDNTPQLLQAYKKKHKNIINVAFEKKQGAQYARNKGWQLSSGEWIQFLDADDELLPHKISRQISISKNRAEVVLGTPIDTDKNGQKIELTPFDDIWKGLGIVNRCGQTSANLYSRKSINNVNGWSEKIEHGQDTDLLLRLLIKEHPVILDKCPSSIYHFDSKNRITQKNKKKALIFHTHISGRLAAYLKTNNPRYWFENQSFFYHGIYHHIRMLACIDPVLASSLFKQYLPNDFKLKPSKEHLIPAWDSFMVNLVGLQQFATFKNQVKNLVPTSLWERIKKFVNLENFQTPNTPNNKVRR